MILSIENISKSFGERKLFENLSIKLDEGKIYTLMGSNGSGKTTLFNIITGFVKIDTGSIIYNGLVINKKSPTYINRIGISRTFQDLRLIKGISVKENVLMALEKGMFHFATDDELSRVDEILEQVSLLELTENMGSDLSYGQQKLLTLGCCLANNPNLLLLDEPIAGVDSLNKEKVKDIILKLKEKGITILQIEHDLEYIKATSDAVFQLNEKGLETIKV